MTSSDDLADLGDLITVAAHEPAELFLGSQYLSVCLNGKLTEALEYLNGKLWSDITKHDQKIIALNLSYAEVDSKETANYVKSLQDLKAKATQLEKVINFIACPQNLQDKLSSTFAGPDVFYKSLTQLLKQFSQASGGFETELDLIIQSVIEVFQKQFGIEATPHEPILMTQDSKSTDKLGEVIGLIPMIGTGASGNLLLRFHSDTLVKLAKHAMSKDLNREDPILAEIAAELVNMVLGCAKTELNQRGYGIRQALPQTFIAQPHMVQGSFLARPSWTVVFDTRFGHVGLEVSIRAF